MRSSAVSRICPACISCRANAAAYTATSRPWPTLAAACWVARSRGRRASRSGASPAAIAPEDTSTTWPPARTRPASAPASAAIRLSSIRPSLVIEDEPTLTTTRRAAATSSRPSASSWLPALSWLPASPSPGPVTRPASRRCRPGPRSPGQPLVAATRPETMRRASRDVRVPVEHDRVVLVTDGHLGTRLRARLGERLLHADPGQPVTEVADRLGVAEVGLAHPAGRLMPAHHEAVLAGPDDLELGPTRRGRPDHLAGGLGRRRGRPCRGDHAAHGKAELTQPFVRGRGYLMNLKPATGQDGPGLPGDLPRGRNVDLVERDDPGTVVKVGAGGIGVGRQFRLDRVEIGDRVPARFPGRARGTVQHVHQHHAPLHVAQELQAEPF